MSTVGSDPLTARAADREPLSALAAVLGQLRALVASLSDADYTRDGSAVVAGTIGGHVRHCLDHVNALLGGLATGEIDYDARERGTAAETRPASAVALLDEQLAALAACPADALARPLQMRMCMTRDGAPRTFATTIGREIAFVHSHTIHHNATIAALARAFGAGVPDDFGYAPATLAYLDRQSCAPSPSLR
ncbi:MAG: DinB family protein [Phycisphaerae bacterium]